MKTFATYLQNSTDEPIKSGEVEIYNIPRKRLRDEPEKDGILCRTVCTGFCGSDYELMQMGKRNELTSKFLPGTERLINGHEGVVYAPSYKKFAIVLIRGGDSFDPSRYGDDETYFEYGCDKADGLMSKENYYHPDMLLDIPDEYVNNGKLPLSTAKRLTFSDPCACMTFQLERLEEIGSAHNYRVETAKNKCSENEARILARRNTFKRTLVFGLGTTGIFMGELICRKYPESTVVFVSRSSSNSSKVAFALEKTGARYVQNNSNNGFEIACEIERQLNGKASVFIGTSGSYLEHQIAFEYGVLGNNGIYDSFSVGPDVSFKTMSFGFKNHLILGSINFRRDHMIKAIDYLCKSDFDKTVDLIGLDQLMKDPKSLYENRIFVGGAALKTAVVWAPEYVDMNG
ncbi:MAG: hypothetical protein FIA99_09560 [Ruminiclostridium sp.]|nr:hypothetical protein [Ruminiclostridium sp.]